MPQRLLTSIAGGISKHDGYAVCGIPHESAFNARCAHQQARLCESLRRLCPNRHRGPTISMPICVRVRVFSTVRFKRPELARCCNRGLLSLHICHACQCGDLSQEGAPQREVSVAWLLFAASTGTGYVTVGNAVLGCQWNFDLRLHAPNDAQCTQRISRNATCTSLRS